VGEGNTWLLTYMLLSTRIIERLRVDASDGNGLPESRLGSFGNFEGHAGLRCSVLGRLSSVLDCSMVLFF
jgi:hypothetical protein